MAWFYGEGRRYVLDFLLRHDLGDYNPHGRAPQTRSHQELVANGRDTPTAYLYHAYEAQEPPFACGLVVVKHVVDHVNSIGRVRLSTRVVEDFLRAIGALRLKGQYRLIAGHDGRSHVWAVREQGRWQDDVSVEQVREAYVHPDDQPGLLMDLQEQQRLTPSVQPRRRQTGEL